MAVLLVAASFQPASATFFHHKVVEEVAVSGARVSGARVSAAPAVKPVNVHSELMQKVHDDMAEAGL